MQRSRGVGVALVVAVVLLIAEGGIAGVRTGPDSRYHDYDEILALCEGWEATYPEIFHREVIGTTLVGGEPIWGIKISDQVNQSEPEARVLIHAAQHSNEPNGTNAVIHMIERLLTRYGVQSAYTQMVDNLEMWFVPVVNVDGHRVCFAGGTHWQDWRKTKRDNNGDAQYTYPIDGVDPNRNWDYRWAEYDSTDWESSRYKGPQPFSEPEVVAIRDLVLRERPLFVVDLHSPEFSTQYNKIWWPWYDPNTYQYSPDHDIYQSISDALGDHCETEVTGVYVNGYNPCYNTLPKEQCWIYANTGICALLYEISDRFWWTGAMVDTVAHRAGRGLLYLMDAAQEGPGITGLVTSALTAAPLRAEVKVLQVHNAAIGPRMTEAHHGQYWRLLEPGYYTVTVSAENHYAQTFTSVPVGTSGWTQLDVQLEADPAGVEPGEWTDARTLWADSPLCAGGCVYFRTATDADASLELLDVSGRRLGTLAEGPRGAGLHQVSLPSGLPAGSYFLRLRTAGEQSAAKVVIIG